MPRKPAEYYQDARPKRRYYDDLMSVLFKLLLVCLALLVIWPVFCATLAKLLPAILPVANAAVDACVMVLTWTGLHQTTFATFLSFLERQANVFGHALLSNGN